MRRLPYLRDASKLTLSGEREEITEAHIFSSRKRKSLSEMFFEWLRPRVLADKAKSPEAYGDRKEAANGGASK